MELAKRFSVIYRISGNQQEALAKAKDICLEQTVEFPEELVPAGFIREQIVGHIEACEPGTKASRVTISYTIDSTAGELTQLLNVIFGNISIKPGIYVEDLKLPQTLLDNYKGPRFGRTGLRKLLKVHDRPLLFTALKPMGLSAYELADLAYKFALGGIDIIKDDHGLTNQPFAPFADRVRLCTEAVQKANRITGRDSIYVANITAGSDEAVRRAEFAKQAGAGGGMISPALSGFDTMKQLAEDDDFGLPVFSHPSFLGSYVTGTNSGISHAVLFGQITRLSGADAVIYPNFGGRFSFSHKECEAIAAGTTAAMGHIKPIFPSPGGGMSIESIPDMRKVYGKDVIFLIGGGLFKYGPDIVKNCNVFMGMVSNW